MSIIRAKHTRNYTVLSNEVINDPELGWDALGLLTYLISKPENWKINIQELQKRSGFGRAKVYRLLKQLQNLGYAKYIRHHNGKTDWLIFDERQKPHDQFDNQDEPHDQFDHDQNDHVLISKEKENKTPIVPYREIVDVYHEVLDNNPKIRVQSDKLQRQLKRLWNYHDEHKDIEWWREYFHHCRLSPFLTNQVTNPHNPNFKVNLEWLTNFNNFAKIVNGNYHNG